MARALTDGAPSTTAISRLPSRVVPFASRFDDL